MGSAVGKTLFMLLFHKKWNTKFLHAINIQAADVLFRLEITLKCFSLKHRNCRYTDNKVCVHWMDVHIEELCLMQTQPCSVFYRTYACIIGFIVY